jgi:serine/threonine protein kinase
MDDERLIAGRYRLVEPIGRGGMGVVWRATDTLLHRDVAVKEVRVAGIDDPHERDQAFQRTLREARLAAGLHHPGIVTIHDVVTDDDRPWIVMERIDARSLDTVLGEDGPLPPDRAARVALNVLDALGAAHAVGVLHRDIKPGNILVDRNGIVKVLDMGLARFFHDNDDILTKKYDENVLGTADYLAPEQALDSHGVDIRADIYSLGATFYFCLTGRPPFADGSVAQKLIWHQTRQPKPLRSIRPDVPEEIAAIVEKAMAKDPAQRYQTPLAVAEALAPYTTTAIALPPESEMPRLSLAAMGGSAAGGDSTLTGVPRTSPSDPPSGTRKPWQVANGSTTSAPPPRPPTPTPPMVTSSPAVNLRPAAAGPPLAPTAPVVRPAAAVQPVSKAPIRPTLSPVPLRPTPAPTRNAAAPVQAPAAPLEEEAASWEELVSDTDDPTAYLDTTPKSGKRSGASRKGASGRNLQVLTASSRRLWIVVGIATAAVALLVSLVIWIAMALSSGPKKQQGQNQPPTLRVDPSGEEKGTYKTIQQAVNQASPNAHIILTADVAEAGVRVGLKENLVIESAAGKRIEWRFPDGSKENKLLNINASPGFELKGVALDGKGKAENLITLFSSCPGLKLTDIDLRNFQNCGVLAANCDGTAKQPISLSDLRFTTTAPDQTGLYFTFINASIQSTEHLIVEHCNLSGPGQPVRATNPEAVKGVKLPDGWKIELAPAKPKS